MSKVAKVEVKELSRILVLIGGVLLIIFGLFTVLGGSFESRYVGISLSGSIFGILVGLIALFGNTRIGQPVWAVILAVLGYFAGGLGGLLVLLGSLIALIMHYV